MRRAAAGTAHILYARSPGGASDGAARRPLAARRSRRPPARPTSRRTCSRRSSSSRAPGRDGRDGRGHRGRRRAHADPRRDRPEPARHGRSTCGAARRLTRRIEPRAAAGRRVQDRVAAERAARRRRALRPGQGPGGQRALSHHREGRAGPRGPRVRLLPHGRREPPGRAAAPHGEERAVQLRASCLLRLHARPQRGGCSSRLAGLGDDSSTYLWRALRRARDHAPVPR